MPYISHPSESRWIDCTDGTTVRQVTSHPSIHHHPFFFVDSWNTAMDFLLMVSHRTGEPQVFIEPGAGEDLIQLTDEPTLAEWSIIPSKDGNWIYFVSGQEGKRVSPASGEVELLAHFGDAEMREKGMVGAAMGTTALSASGRWWAVPVKTGDASRFWLMDAERKSAEVFLEQPTIGHPQFCPDDSDLILFAGPLTDRVWVTDRAGQHRRIYKREHDLQWVTHEVWRPGHRSVLFVDWPNGMREIDVVSNSVQTVSRFPIWHGAPDCTGDRLVCDTNFPDKGLHLISLTGQDAPRFVHRPEASSQGSHWAGPFPYNHGPIKVHAPQHTHPHPRISPDGKLVVFTSDRSGCAQVYVVSLED